MKFGKDKVEIVLKKDGAENITVRCPEKIKMSVGQALFALRFGLPPMDIKPIDKKWLGILVGCFAAIFAIPFFMSCFNANPFFIFIALIWLIAFNLILTKNFFCDFILEKLIQGYTVNNEQESLLKSAGVLPLPEKNSYTLSRKKFWGIAGGAVLVLFVLGAATGSGDGVSGRGKVKYAVKELEKINNSESRYWVTFIKTYGINAIDDDGDTLLYAAVDNGNLPLAKACLKSGADIKMQVHNQYILTYASPHYELAKFLLDNGAVVPVEERYNLINSIMSASSMWWSGGSEQKEKYLSLLIDNFPKDKLDFIKNGYTFFNQPSSMYADTYYNQVKRYSNLIKRLADRGWKPGLRDFEFIIRWILTSGDAESSSILLDMVEKLVKDKSYRKLNENNPDHLLHYLYSAYCTNYENRYELCEMFIKNGYNVQPLAKSSSKPESLITSKDEDMNMKLYELFKKAGYNFSEVPRKKN